MRRLAATLAVVAAGLAVGSAATAQQMGSMNAPYGGQYSLDNPRYEISRGPPLLAPKLPTRADRYLWSLKALRAEGLALRKADGGVLTPAHAQALQAKLDGLNATYQVSTR